MSGHAFVTTPAADGGLLVVGPTYGDHAYVAIYNTTFPAPPGIKPGWLLSRADYGVPGHTPVARFDTEEEAKSAEYGLNADLGWSDEAAYLIVVSSMRGDGTKWPGKKSADLEEAVALLAEQPLCQGETGPNALWCGCESFQDCEDADARRFLKRMGAN